MLRTDRLTCISDDNVLEKVRVTHLDLTAMKYADEDAIRSLGWSLRALTAVPDPLKNYSEAVTCLHNPDFSAEMEQTWANAPEAVLE